MDRPVNGICQCYHMEHVHFAGGECCIEGCECTEFVADDVSYISNRTTADYGIRDDEQPPGEVRRGHIDSREGGWVSWNPEEGV